MRVVITGAGGFVGPHLSRVMRARGATVLGWSDHSAADIDTVCDLRDPAATDAAMAAARPDAVIHLAGLSSVADCAKDPAQAFAVNTQGTWNLLLAVKRHRPKARVLFVSSGEVYGAAAGPHPIDETVAAQPINIYGATKRAAEVLALQLAHEGLEVVIARSFNHIGAGQTPTFVLPSFARQLAQVPRGSKVVLNVGNLAAVRDFSHVDDVVEGYALLLDKGERGQFYNVGSGTGRAIEALLQMLVKLSGRDAEVQVDPARLRPLEIPALVGKVDKMKALGWAPHRPLEQALGELMEQMELATR
ncbi:MAG: GDP-mannose 4,6-dehydratase [Myxococcaceae bacterium]